MEKEIKSIPYPTNDEVRKYLNKWDEQKNYVLQESSLSKLFQKTYPENIDMDDVLIKVCSLNDFYSTYILSPFSVAKHIVDLKIDNRLQTNDISLVNDISKVKIQDKDGNWKTYTFYSFATKYCSHHKPLDYPIYDYYVEKVLNHFKKQDNKFCSFKNDDLRKYEIFKNIVIKFKSHYELKYNLKEIDRYLWQLGKDYFLREDKKRILTTSSYNPTTSQL